GHPENIFSKRTSRRQSSHRSHTQYGTAGRFHRTARSQSPIPDEPFLAGADFVHSSIEGQYTRREYRSRVGLCCCEDAESSRGPCDTGARWIPAGGAECKSER